MELLIDADPLVYRCGFAAEDASYSVVLQNAAGDLEQLHFSSGKNAEGEHETAGARMKAALLLRSQAGWEVLSKEKQVVPAPKSHALFLARQSLEDMVGRVMQEARVKELTVRVVLSGADNYREGIAKQRPYKGNRDEAAKPYWYAVLRTYLTDIHDAYVVTGREADDEIGIRATRAAGRYCVATIDKDLDQVPGWHYDYVKKVFYAVTEQEAREMFWRQALSGDATDNIPGCYKLGAVKAAAIIREAVDSGYSDADLWELVCDKYTVSQTIAHCPYAQQDAAEVALETARLVYIQREPQELWTPPGWPKQTIGGNLDD
jgi:hypothetical protein